MEVAQGLDERPPAFLPVKDGYHSQNLEPGFLKGLDGFHGGSAGGDDVLYQDDLIADFEGTLNELASPVILGFGSHIERVQVLNSSGGVHRDTGCQRAASNGHARYQSNVGVPDHVLIDEGGQNPNTLVAKSGDSNIDVDERFLPGLQDEGLVRGGS